MTDGIVKCLQEVNKFGMTEVAFPALGTGNLGFPAADVTQCFLQAAKQFPHIKVLSQQ